MQTDGAGLPVALRRSVPADAPRRDAAPLERVAQLEEVWRIAEEWWREQPLARTYYRVITDGGRSLTLFHDDLGTLAGPATSPATGWYEQRYSELRPGGALHTGTR